MVVMQEDVPTGSEFDLDGFIAGLDLPDENLTLHPLEQERVTQLYLACKAKNWSPEAYTQLHTSVRLLLTSLQGLKRENGDPSSTHSFDVALIVLEEMKMGPDEVIGALLHDIPEDTKKRGTEIVTLDHIDRLFGPVMANRIDGLTKVKSSNNSDLLAQTHHKIFTLEQDDAPGVSIKLADRLHGMRTLQHLYPDKQKVKSTETLDTYVPLAYSLGYHKLAEELTYWSVYYLLPKDKRPTIDSYMPGTKEAIAHAGFSLMEEFESNMTSILEHYEGGIMFRLPSLFDRYRASGGELEGLLDEELPITAIITLSDVNLFTNEYIEGENSSAKAWKDRAMLVVSHMHGKNMLNDDQFLDLKKTIERNGKLIRYPIQVGGKLLHLRFVDPLYIHYQEASLADYIDSNSPLYAVAHDKVERLQENYRRISSSSRSVNQSALEFNEILLGGVIVVYDAMGKPYGLPEGATALDAAFAFKSKLGKRVAGVKIKREGQPKHAGRVTDVLHHGDTVTFEKAPKITLEVDWLDHVVTPAALKEIQRYFREQVRKERSKNLPIESREITQLLRFRGIERIRNLFAELSQEEGYPREMYIDLDHASTLFDSIPMQYPTMGKKIEQRCTNFLISVGLREIEGGEDRNTPVWQVVEHLMEVQNSWGVIQLSVKNETGALAEVLQVIGNEAKINIEQIGSGQDHIRIGSMIILFKIAQKDISRFRTLGLKGLEPLIKRGAVVPLLTPWFASPKK